MALLVRFGVPHESCISLLPCIALVDPYVTLVYSRLGKPLFSTRIIKADRFPVFEETGVVTLDKSVLRLRETLRYLAC